MSGEGRKNRNRGFGFEREIVNAAKERGLAAERCWGSDGKSKGLPSNVDVIIEGMHFQCKRVKALSARIKPDENIHGQVFREDRGKPLIVLPFEEYLEFLGMAKRYQSMMREYDAHTPSN